MPRISLSFDRTIGPVIPVTISYPSSALHEDELPKSEIVTMLIDSGASDSSISGVIADRLSLPVLGYHRVSGFGASGAAYQYFADLDLPLDAPYELRDWKLLRFESEYDKIQGILGRDFLCRGTFVLDGPNDQFTLDI